LAISRQRKEELVAQYIELLNGSRAVFLTEYTGVTVNQLEELRGEIRKVDGAFHITKNTLLRHALQEVGRSLPDEMLTGQTAAGFALGELPSLAKALVDFAEKEETFTIKGGLMNGEFLSAAEIEALAKLPSLDELRAQIIGLVNAPARNVASTVASGVRQLMNVINAYATQDEEAAEPA
jgi:large subunit ribosomal protein L10